MALLKCTDLTLGYEGNAVVTDLNFEINSGDYLCIVGENGSGKSTLMRTLNSAIFLSRRWFSAIFPLRYGKLYSRAISRRAE